MPFFIIRIELENASFPDDYAKLHKAMKDNGFQMTITGSSGAIYDLPDAEYVKIAETTSSELLNEVINIVKSAVTQKYGIIVTQSASQSFVGLKMIKEAPTKK